MAPDGSTALNLAAAFPLSGVRLARSTPIVEVHNVPLKSMWIKTS